MVANTTFIAYNIVVDITMRVIIQWKNVLLIILWMIYAFAVCMQALLQVLPDFPLLLDSCAALHNALRVALYPIGCFRVCSS